jgi:hypothetical protein
MCIYYILIVVNLRHVSVTFVAISGRYFYEGYINKDNQTMCQYKILNFEYLIHNIYFVI